ncbi:hypothetical protein FJT64_012758 [Amphibalanus amphitrite]|uniref:ZAD domain-containing protein n=1 Tax=Amphibalanus amphitrite TaxID=1232801 RepID=A0A6A4V706_AMPAM|nr:hypothetical protein FJT64_012758 [Amphibalanus amphitrite]
MSNPLPCSRLPFRETLRLTERIKNLLPSMWKTLRTDSPACAAGGSLDSGDDTSLSPINVEIEVHCLICSTLINLQLDQYCDIYLDNIVTAHSKLPVSEKLGRVLRYHFSPELLYSHTLCRRCFNIINGIDQLEGRLDKLSAGGAAVHSATAAR